MPTDASPPPVFKLIVAGVLAFLLTLIVCLPARVLGFFLPGQVTVGHLAGTVWHGHTDSFAIDGRPYGALEWKLHPLHLFRGRLALDGHLSSTTRDLRGLFALGLGHSLQAWNVELRWPVDSLPFKGVPPGWNGMVQATLREAALKDGKIQVLIGTLDARDLHKPPPENVAVGSYRLTFDEKSKQGNKLVGRLQDLDGPMEVSGTVTFDAGQPIMIAGLVKPRPGAAESILNTLNFLGPPDAQGRRPFSTEVAY